MDSAENLGFPHRLRVKPESRTFRVTSDTKVEGKLKMKVRVTVRYVAVDDGERATLIVVHTAVLKPK